MLNRLDIGLEEIARAQAARDTSHWSSLVDRVLADCHPFQREFVLDPGRYITALVGRGGGKTTGGRARFVRRMLRQANARCVYLAKTRDHAKRLMWLPLKSLLDGLGFVAGRDVIYNETALTATLSRNGASLRLCGADKPSDLESLRGESFDEVGIDEGGVHPDGLLTDLIHSIVGPRLLGALWVIGTPGKICKGLFFEITRRGSKLARQWKDREQFPGWRGWSLHKWSLKAAVDATADRPIAELVAIYQAQQQEIADQQLSDDNPVKRREYDGEWAESDTVNIFRYRIYNEDGVLWNQWNPERTGSMRIGKLPDTFKDWAHVIAMDFGHNDPTAINVFAFSPSDPTRTIYHRLGFEATKMYAQLIAYKLIGEQLNHDKPDGIIGAIETWPDGIVADSAHLGELILEELANVYGIRAEPAQKGYKYKYGAIEVVNGDLVDGRIKVLKDSELEAQLLDLQWVENRFGELRERKDQPNHSTDTLIYARALISKLITAGTVAPQNSNQPRSRYDEPAIPETHGDDDYSHLFQDDYEALLG